MIAAILLFAAATEVAAPVPIARVAEDGRVIDRVAEVSKRDLPIDLLRRLVESDIEILRGRRSDGTYAYATYERLESARHTESYSVESTDAEKPMRIEVKGSWVYRLLLDMPSRRMILSHNRRVFVDHVDIEYMPAGGSTTKTQSVKVNAWMDPGTQKIIDLDDVARQATVHAYVHADTDGYGNIDVALLEAKIVDNSDSPYADAVASAKAILRGLDHGDIPSIRSMATRMANDLQPSTTAPAVAAVPARAEVEVSAPKPAEGADLYGELQGIEDLLTGSEAEKRQGLDRLHQLLRRLRQSR